MLRSVMRHIRTGKARMHMVVILKLVIRARSRVAEKMHSLFGLDGW